MSPVAHSGDINSQGAIKILDRLRVVPAAHGTEATPPAESTIALTYFDMLFVILPPVERLFLYRLPPDNASTEHFLAVHLPRLKHALSLALAVFYPLAGCLVKPQAEAIPFIRCADGDSVELIVAVSQLADFDELAGDAPKQTSRLHPLVPTTEKSPSEDTGKQPLLKAQVTLFPGRGVALAVVVSHCAADGSSSTHFLKTWAALCRELEQKQDVLNDGLIDIERAVQVRPILDRSIVKDPKGLREIYFADITRAVKMGAFDFPKPGPLLRATFSLSRADLDALRRRADPPAGTRYSSFTVASALTWVCTVKTRGNLEEPEKVFSFVPNIRSRIDPPLPAAYFGNCLGSAMAVAKTDDLVGDKGLAVAAAAIWNEVQGLRDGGMLVRLGEKLFEGMTTPSEKKRPETMSVAGSPSLGVYEVNFGWGKPAKVEVVSCDKTGGISLAETADGGRGVEVGVLLPPEAMPEFERLWCCAFDLDG